MNLRVLRRQLRSWAQRPAGRCLAWFLAFALVAGGLPVGQVHAHAGGDFDHDHLASALVTDAAGDAAAPESSVPGTTVLHLHEATVATPALPDVPMLRILPLTVAAGNFAPERSDARPRTDVSPPYRPPIA